MVEWILSNILFILLGLGTLMTFLWLLNFTKKLRIKWWIALIVSLLHTVASVLFAKIFAVMESFDFSKIQGMSLFGGLFFLPILFMVCAKIFKRKVSDVCDIMTIPSLFIVLSARVNCLFAGCCLGTIIPGTDNIRWPTREIELIFYIVLVIILGVNVLRDKTNGRAYPIYMATYGVLRFILEFMRDKGSNAGLIHLSHFWAIIAIIVGVSICSSITVEINKKHKKDK